MTAWDIRKYVLACDHYDKTPGIVALVNPDGIRCTARFEMGFGNQRAKVRREARKKGWVHVHEPGAARQTDKDFCPRHYRDVPVGSTGELADFDPSTGRSSLDDWK